MKHRDAIKLFTVLIGCVGAFLVMNPSPVSAAKPYPTKPLRLVIGFPPGGSSDILARDIAKRLYESWSQPIIVDNRTGASGVVAAHLVSQALPDGHTLLIVPSTFYNNILLRPSMPVAPFADFAAVSKLAIVGNVLVVPNSLSVQSIGELISAAKAKPGALSFASGGVGTTHHLGIELFRRKVGIDIIHVPYKGTPPALLDAIAGRIQLMLAGLPPTLPLVRDGRLRAIGVSTLKRLPELPNVPAIAETVKDFEATLGYVLLVPAKTPRNIISKLDAELLSILRQESLMESFSRLGFIADGQNSTETLRYLKEEYEKWASVIKAANIKIN